MARATTCVLDGREIGVDEALLLRDEAEENSVPRPDFRCGTCDKPVRPHRESPMWASPHRAPGTQPGLSVERRPSVVRFR